MDTYHECFSESQVRIKQVLLDDVRYLSTDLTIYYMTIQRHVTGSARRPSGQRVQKGRLAGPYT